jgi:hypothetical protein
VLLGNLVDLVDIFYLFFQTPTSGVNGPLFGYKVIYAPIPGSETEKDVSGGQTIYTMTNLGKWTSYRIKVKCYNDKGDGPSSADVINRTLEDGKYVLQVYSHYFHFCTL